MNSEQHLKYWAAVHELLQSALRTLPGASEPDGMYWSHPEEEWKNEAALQSKADDAGPETRELIHSFCETQKWPKRSKNDARYFVSKRLQWALKFTRILVVPDSKTGQAAIPRPPQSGFDFLEWLLIDAYAGRNPPPPKTTSYMVAFNLDGTTTEKKIES